MAELKVNVLKLHPRDNIVVALSDIKEGEELILQGESLHITAAQNVPYGHKFAVKDIHKHGHITKYGETMGIATENIGTGYHVHVSNVRGLNERERLQQINK